ncbi:hypothetical protein GCM10008955_36760 [Deinococcus malanensis]|uniref:Uncharacterized protein n=1 Tax=Deinococcus malanensis TaxID=1706855 RepID=A0ABQ2F242_9DEIO|nr:hypothetical protein [Deinococcus malanensis]GGK39582.1 hypothetical protein GCM10008955_36760 [Deinococcus malanensis]
MDTNQARFLFEVQRVGDRVGAECQYTPAPSQPPVTPRPSLRRTLALWLHHLASQVDVPSLQPA